MLTALNDSLTHATTITKTTIIRGEAAAATKDKLANAINNNFLM